MTIKPLPELQIEEIVVRKEAEELLKHTTDPCERMELEDLIRAIELFQEADNQ